ncbi:MULTISPECIES: flagellar motor protein MotB [unclassified Sphingomonas]|uniref:flagellar motor protein MotB n=1 Tax=unclassified Sphingomonas TaxID=196159 RepID=UPI001F5A35D4|nr:MULTISPECIES: flagellar motor protein MotB [unclassified Sphingomonas]
MASHAPNARPIVIRKIKKSAAGHHGGAWKVAYADFVTAMMAFFMLLWLISNPDKQRLKGLAEYFSPSPPSTSASGFGESPGERPGNGGYSRKMDADATKAHGVPAMDAQTRGVSRGGTANVPDASLRVLAQELRVALDSGPPSAATVASKVDAEGETLRITLMDTANRPMFQAGTARLNAFARDRMATIAARLAKSDARLTIEGHTDGAGGEDEANWRLSGERALAARAVLLAGGLTPDRIAGVIAKAASEPVYPDQPDRAENRRITIIVKGEKPTLPTDASFKF